MKKQPSGEIAVSDSQATKPAVATDAGRNPIYEGQFDGETPEQAAHRLHWAKAGLAMGRDVAADQHARDSAVLRRLCAERDQLRNELADLKAQPSGVVLPDVTRVMRLVFDYQHNKNINVTGTTNWAANIGMVVLDEVARLNQQPASGVYSTNPLACTGCVSGCFRCRNEPANGGDDRAAFEAAYASVVDNGWTNVKHMGWQVWQKARAALPVLEAVAEGWQLAADALPATGETVLAYYLNSHGMARRIRAMHVKRFTVEAEEFADPDTQCCEYSEQHDCHYTTEGWYELIDNWPDYSSCAVIEGVITHWMPLPAAPSPSREGE